MKKNYFLLLALFIMPSMYVYSLDVILTKSRMQIQCNIISQDENTVTYQLIDSQDKELYTMEKADIEKIYPHTEDIATRTEPKNESQKPEEKSNDILVLKDGTQLDVILVEVSDKQVKYRKANNPTGPLFVKEIANITSIMYANGEKEDFTQENVKVAVESPIQTQTPQKTQQQVMIQSQQQLSASNRNTAQDIALARVDNYSGVCVFTDCVPLAKYEVLGDISFNKSGDGSYFVMSGPLVLAGGGETPQYTDIRNGLISQAVLANRQVEGVLITIAREGMGKATMIKFTDPTEDKTLAKVNSHIGVLVFTDCSPLANYYHLGKINGAGGLNSDYNILRDKLIKKSVKKYPNVQGIIPRFVSGGKDSAEAIKF